MAVAGQPHLQVHDGDLFVEDIPVAALAREHGTPLFVYSQSAILTALASYQKGLSGRDALICYAVKANSNLSILRLLVNAGCGLDIVSGGELERALAAGCDPKKIVFSGVGKTRREILRALEVGVGCYNVESEAELDLLGFIAEKTGKKAPVSIRVNPDVDAKTHPYISTGLRDNKFGIAHDQAARVYKRAAQLPGIEIRGIDCHIGSQITDMSPYLDAMDRVLELIKTIESDTNLGIRINHIDFGGGLGIDYGDQGTTPLPEAAELWAQLLSKLDSQGYGDRQIIIEPGRSLVGNAGLCLTEVLFLKPGEFKNFAVVDVAMNDLPRPAMYGAYHQILPVTRHSGQSSELKYDIVGPVCESGDWIGRDRMFDLESGDILAVLSAGAYCMSMASNYNTRGRAAEVLVNGYQYRIIRRRETIEDQLARERVS